MTSIFLTAFTTVLLAEMIGDKSLLLVIGLAERFRRASVLVGMTAAVIAKIGVAVLFGGLLVHIPKSLTSLLTGVTFIVAGILLILERDEDRHIEQDKGSRNPVLLAFGAIFFSDWCDPGQLATVALTAKFSAPLVVGLAAVLALLTKFVLALVVGSYLPKFVPRHVLRYSLVVTLFAAGLLSCIAVFR